MYRILVLCFLIPSFNVLRAQPEFLDTVVVSASAFSESMQEANRSVITINKRELADLPVQSVADVLDFAVGIDARQRGALGTQTDLSIRGSTFEQVLVLVDGVRISDPQTGHHLMNLPVSKENIERIEVLLGGGSYIFGSSAFAGAVNIITKKGKQNRFTVDAAGGSYDSYRISARQELRGDKHQTSLSFRRTQSGGFKRNTDFDVNNLFAQSHIELDSGQYLDLTGGFTWQEFGAQSFYSNRFPEQWESTATLFLNAVLTSEKEDFTLRRKVFWRRNWDEFQLFREGPDYYQYNEGFFIDDGDTAPAFYGGHNYHRSDVLGGAVEAQMESTLGKTALSAAYRFERVVSNNLGEPLAAPIRIEGKRGNYTLGAHRQNVSLSAQQRKAWGRLSLSGALQVNFNSDFAPGIFPGLTAGYKINSQSRLYGSVNRSFRLPSYTELYYNLGGAIGSDDLLPEQSINYELGYKRFGTHYFLNATVFRREGDNIIDWTQQCDTCDLIAGNITEVNFNGAEVQAKLSGLSLMERWRMSYLRLGYSYIRADRENFDYQSLYVFDYLQHKATVQAAHRILEKLTFSYSYSLQARNGTYVDAESGQTENYQTVHLVNAQLSYNYGMGTLYVNAQNLLNQRYYDRGNVELPGLYVWVGGSVGI